MAVTAYAELNQNVHNSDYPVYSRYELDVKKLFPSESKRAILVITGRSAGHAREASAVF